MQLQADGLGAGDAGGMYPAEVPEFFLGPQLDHLPVVALVGAGLEAVLAGDVPLPVLEDKDGGLVDLDGALLGLGAVVGVEDCAVDVGLLAGADGTVDLADDAAVDHLQQDHAGALVEDELGGGAVGLVLVAVLGLLDIVEADLGGVLGEIGNLVVDVGAGVRGGLRRA